MCLSVAVEGKVIVAGFTSRDAPELPMNDLMQLPSFSLIGVSLTNYRNKMLPVYRWVSRKIFVHIFKLFNNLCNHNIFVLICGINVTVFNVIV